MVIMKMFGIIYKAENKVNFYGKKHTEETKQKMRNAKRKDI